MCSLDELISFPRSIHLSFYFSLFYYFFHHHVNELLQLFSFLKRYNPAASSFVRLQGPALAISKIYPIFLPRFTKSNVNPTGQTCVTFFLVENIGFEPMTPCLQSRCSSQLS
jgi:hypothetical protein